MRDTINSFVTDILNPVFEDIAAEPVILKFGDLSILGYTANFNEKQLDEGLASLRVIEVISNNLLFDPDKVCIFSFNFPVGGIIGDLILDGNVIVGDTLTIEELVTKFNEFGLIDTKLQVDGTKVSFYKYQPIMSNEAIKGLYVKGSGIVSLGAQEGYRMPQTALFYVNGYSYKVRDNTFKPCYMGKYLKFQLVRK